MSDKTRRGWVAIKDDKIDAIGQDQPPDGPFIDGKGSILRPGYIDLHCHGGGGASVYSGDVDDVVHVAATHLAHGTTSMMASVTAASRDALINAASSIAEAADNDRASNIAGIHFEGPYLSERRPGAQVVQELRWPNADELEELLMSAGSLSVSMTIAPELPGAITLIRQYSDRVRFFIGHTDASGHEFDQAVDAGATAVTHLFNAMPPLHHRSPGPVGRAILDERVTSELIMDGHHLDDDTVRLVLAAAGPGRLMLVTDAMAAAGMADGEYSLPGLNVSVQSGAVFVRGTSTLAGSALLMDAAVTNLMRVAHLTDQQVSQMSSSNAARTMGWNNRGAIEVGSLADLVATDEQGELHLVISRGELVMDGASAREFRTDEGSAKPFI